MTKSGQDASTIGDRVPGLWLHNSNKLYVGMDMSGKLNQVGDSEPIEENKWYTLEFSQKQVDGKVGGRITED